MRALFKIFPYFVKRFLYTLSVIIFVAATVKSQELQFTTITVNDGLSQHDVSCILQDSYGFIWIGTYDGLNRYDGYRVQNYFHITENENSLSSNRIRCLFEDSKKRIWIGTDGGGINYYSLAKERFFRIQTPENYQNVQDFIETKEGEIYIATNQGVLKIIENGKAHRTEIIQFPLNGLNVNGMEFNANKEILFSTSNGIWKLNGKEIEQILTTKDKWFVNLFVLNQYILASTENKLIFLSEDDNFRIHEIEELKGKVIRDIELSKQGEIWVGTLTNGIYRIDTVNFKILENIKVSSREEKGILSNSVLCLHCDNSNMLWVGNRRGLCFTNLSPKKFHNLELSANENIPKHAHVRTLLVDSTCIYFGLQNHGLFRYSLLDGTLTKYLDKNNIFPITIEKIGDQINVGTNFGVFTKDKYSKNFRLKTFKINNEEVNDLGTFAISKDKFGNEYFGTFSGLVIKREDRTYWLHNEYPQTDILRGKRVFSLYYDESDNSMWIGTISGGLFKLNLQEDGSFLSLEKYHSNVQGNYHIVNNTTWCFYKSKDNTLWIGTDAGLLKKKERDNHFFQIKTQGIVDKKIMGILEDENRNLWLSNSQGLIRYNPNTNEVRRFSSNDGLNSSTFTEAIGKNEDGTMFFGSINGINYFQPEEIKNSNRESTVVLSDFKVHNKSIIPDVDYFGKTILTESINLTKRFTLNHNQNNFLFEFTGTNYINTAESNYRYKLENYEPNWIYTNSLQRFASYSNLKPGTYTFCVQAANQDGIWGDNYKEINIKILPAPWFSIWAYLFYFVLFLSLLLVFIYFLRNRQKLQHELELEHFRNTQDKKINELKLSFFTDIAHEFKTPLSLIIGPINDLIQNKIGNNHHDFCYQVVSRNTKRMMLLVNQLLDFRKINANRDILKISESDLSDFINQTTKAFGWQAKNESINFNIIKPDKLVCFFDRDIIEKVVYNLLSNAFKFTPAHGIVEIEVKSIWKEKKHIANIIIKDSGKGIPEGQKEKIFERFFHGTDQYSSGIGLHLSYTLIKAHKGEINVSDSIFGGTEFIISIPVSKDSYEENEFFEMEEATVIPESILPEIALEKKNVTPERENILIVEDDHDMRKYLKNILHAKYNVFEASNGVKGLNKALTKIPDVIITDIMMPEKDGIEMCKELKNKKETSHIPILMLTAKTDQVQQNEGLDAGAWDYINKPFDTHALLSKINNILVARNKFWESIRDQNLSVEIKKHYTSFDQQLIAKATKVVYENIDKEGFSIEDISVAVGLSRMQLHRKLKSIAGYSATEFVNIIKIQYTKKMFDEGCDRINEAMDAIGMSSYTHFNKKFVKVVGITASDYIKNKTQEANFSNNS